MLFDLLQVEDHVGPGIVFEKALVQQFLERFPEPFPVVPPLHVVQGVAGPQDKDPQHVPVRARRQIEEKRPRLG